MEFVRHALGETPVRTQEVHLVSEFTCLPGSAMKTIMRNLFAILILSFLFLPILSFSQTPQLIPQPREVETKRPTFGVPQELQINILSPLQPGDRLTARSLQEELEVVTGHTFPVVAAIAMPPEDTPAIVLGKLDQSPVADYLRRQKINASGIGEQGYVLDVTPRRVIVAGKDAPGLFYGVQTLRQLVVGTPGGAAILGVRVRDWPAMLYRGTQVDLARGPVPKLDYLKRIVRTISEFKLNQLYMYMEDSFRLEGQPLVGVLSDTLSREDWRELIAYAQDYHVDIIPAQNSCGHLHKILRFEKYSDLGERPHGHVLAPDPASLVFLQSLYSQMVSVFPAQFYNIGCDETWELGQGKSAAKAQQEGMGQLYIDDLLRVHDLVRSYNKQPIFWGDIALKYPELIKTLPQDLVVATWEYFVHPNYDKWLKPYQDAGIRIIVCPWVGNTNLMMPDYEQAAVNIGRFVGEGKRRGAIGMDNTVWNDDGETLYGLNWWSIVYGAAASWEQGTPDVSSLDQKFDWAFYRNTDHRFVEAIKQLSHINETLRQTNLGQVYGEDYGGTDDDLFWRNPFDKEGQADMLRALPVASKVRLMAEDAYTVFSNSASRAKRNADTLPYLKLAALRLDALGMRYLFVQEIAQDYANAVAHQNDSDRNIAADGLGQILGTNGRMQDLRDYTTRLRELYQELWLSENRPTWLPNILQLYDQQTRQWQDQIEKFQQVDRDFGEKKPLPPADSLGLPVVPATR
jgi:hexosaminidase